ncbi:MAG: hypothetical protein IJ650_00895 [Paludibacteraceae bacterium]|nr:hypothetical protein [Paludibacteraceae bacterium]
MKKFVKISIIALSVIQYGCNSIQLPNCSWSGVDVSFAHVNLDISTACECNLSNVSLPIMMLDDIFSAFPDNSQLVWSVIGLGCDEFTMYDHSTTLFYGDVNANQFTVNESMTDDIIHKNVLATLEISVFNQMNMYGQPGTIIWQGAYTGETLFQALSLNSMAIFKSKFENNGLRMIYVGNNYEFH